MMIDVLQTIHTKTSFERFIVGGSWNSACISEGICTLTPSKDHDDADKLDLDAYDIDMYHASKSIVVDFKGGIEKLATAGL